MKAEMRSTMQAAAQVQVFNQAYPVTDPGVAPVIADFDRRVARADALIGQQAENTTRSIAANRARHAVRKRLVEGLLRLFVGFFRLEAGALPDLRGIKVPRVRSPDPVFLLAADRILAAAEEHLPVLAGHGLTQTLLDEAAGLVDEFRSISAEAREAYQARVEASRALDTARHEIFAAIQRMDRLNRHRFAGQEEVLARWDAARNVINRSPRSRPNETAEPEAGAEGGVADAA